MIHSFRDGDSKRSYSTVEKGTEFQHIFDEFFKLSGGIVDQLDIHCKLEGDPPIKRDVRGFLVIEQ